MNEPHDNRNAADARDWRLDELREQAAESAAQLPAETGRPRRRGALRGYYGQPVLKPPVWTWEVPAYFFVGGAGGMAAVIALASLATGAAGELTRASLWLAAAGAIVSPVLLTMDLGRPRRFLNMLRVFKRRSPMSVGAWTLVVFGAAAVPAAVLLEVRHQTEGAGVSGGWTFAASIWITAAIAAPTGALLATYTGVLLGATAIPAWSSHHRVLPVHFGLAGLGSAAAMLELLGHRAAALNVIGLGVAALETGVGIWVELHRHGAADRALRQGRSGLLLRGSGVLAGPAALSLRLFGLVPAAAAGFLLGALMSRFGWLQAGRASALDPKAVFEDADAAKPE